MKYNNMELKKGQRLKLITIRNGSKSWEGKLVTVLSLGTERRTALVEDADKKRMTIYQTGPGDIWTFVNRKEQAAALKLKIKDCKKEIEEIEKEIIRLEKFDSDEAEAAYKFEKILKKPTRQNIEKILREMKKSDYL